MHWWQQQFQAWQEISFGLLMLFLGLYIEDRIDQWRFQRMIKGAKQQFKAKHAKRADKRLP